MRGKQAKFVRQIRKSLSIWYNYGFPRGKGGVVWLTVSAAMQFSPACLQQETEMPSFSMDSMIQPSPGKTPALTWNPSSLLTVLPVKTHFLSHCFPRIWSCKVQCFSQKQGKPVVFSWQKAHSKSPGSLGTGFVYTLECRHWSDHHRDKPLSTSAFEQKQSKPPRKALSHFQNQINPFFCPLPQTAASDSSFFLK